MTRLQIIAKVITANKQHNNVVVLNYYKLLLCCLFAVSISAIVFTDTNFKKIV